jgi:hypothetical protein
MLTIGDVTVTMTDQTLDTTGHFSGYGRTWSVTFSESHYQSLMVSSGSTAIVSAGGSLKGSMAMVYVERLVIESVPASSAPRPPTENPPARRHSARC